MRARGGGLTIPQPRGLRGTRSAARPDLFALHPGPAGGARASMRREGRAHAHRLCGGRWDRSPVRAYGDPFEVPYEPDGKVLSLRVSASAVARRVNLRSV